MSADAFFKSSLGEMAYGICVLSAQVADLSQKLTVAETEKNRLQSELDEAKNGNKNA